MKNIGFHVDTRLAKLLAENYRSSEKALKELVDNAWDADATKVSISLPTPMSTDPIIIEDDGIGMSEESIMNQYLFIASDRRQKRGEFTPLNKRRVKGRKGIGKFAGLLLAQDMSLETWINGKKCAFSLSTKDYDLSEDISQLPIRLQISNFPEELHGSKILLFNLSQSLAFPSPEKLRQILIHEYGREEGFSIVVNGKELGIDDIQGQYTSHEANIPEVGKVSLQFTISNQKGKLRQPGISIRVGGKIVGKPDFFGLDASDDFPLKLLNKLYGEVEADGLLNHITSDWGAIYENSSLFLALKEYYQPILRQKFKEQYGREINLAQARLQKKVNERIALLPEYKREYADKAIKAVLGKYYGEPESKLESVVTVLLDALERTDYRAVLDYIHEAKHSDIAKLAEVLAEFGLAEIAIIGEQAHSRLEFLDRLEELCLDNSTKEKLIHSSLENNLWVFGVNYSIFSSNKSLKKQVEAYLDKEYKGKRADKRPDLILNANYANDYLLIEFKRPNHPLNFKDYQQAIHYRNDLSAYISSSIKVILLGGSRSNDLLDNKYLEPNVEILIFSEIISSARYQLNWLIKELGGEKHA